MIKIYLVIVVLFASSNVAASSICQKSKDEFKAAAKIYTNRDGAAFMKRMLKNGPLENDQKSTGQAQSLNQVEQFFGKFQSASILSTKQLGNRSCYLIGILEYENGPAFAVANYYQTEKGVSVTSMFFKTEPEQILPKEFLVQ